MKPFPGLALENVKSYPFNSLFLKKETKNVLVNVLFKTESSHLDKYILSDVEKICFL